jgi:alpha-D-ribose 1-methylphosphonate 5-triphosphate diphosphatase
MIGLRADTVVACSGAPDDGAPGWVVVDGGRIASVGPEPSRDIPRVDLGDVQLWPGIIDLHADSLGRYESPRPGTRIPLSAAVYDFALDAATHGVTRSYLCVSVGEGPDPAATFTRAREVVGTVELLDPVLPVAVPIHLRVDVGADNHLADARALLEQFRGRIALLSAMDHTPGRGQYHDTPSWRVAMRARTGADDQALDAWLSWLPADPVTVRHRARAVAALAAEFDLPFASHDDATPTDAQEAADHGATISEFPLTRGAADAAHAAGLAVVMGAPNAWRGRSHLTGLSARDALRAGTLDALTSDYHTAALVRAAVVLAADEVCPLPTSVHLVTAGPAAAVALDSGRLATGRPADLIAVSTTPVPTVVGTWVAGRPTRAANGLAANLGPDGLGRAR